MAGLRNAVAAIVTAGSVAGGANALLPGGQTVTPEQIAHSAYVTAAQTASCHIDWRWLAAIRSIESPASIGTEQADGTVPGVAGPALDGSGVGGNTQAILDTNGNPDRALGPMQFIPSSWALFGRDGNGDGQVDIDNLYDATAAAAGHLCSSIAAGSTPWEAIRDYNGSGPSAAAYADTALSRADALDPQPGPIVAIRAAKAKAATSKCDIATTASGAPDIADVAHCAAQRTWEQLLAGWEATGQLIHRDGDRQPVAGLYALLDRQIAQLTGGERPAPATTKPTGNLRAPTTTRTDGLDPRFGAALDRFIADAPGQIGIRSGRRDPAEQLALYQAYLNGTGNLAAWSDGTSCSSDHCAGMAADLTYPDAATEAWAHNNAARYGLQFDVAGEGWHVSLQHQLR